MKLDITNKIYNDDDAARAHLEEQLWPDGPFCPHCGSFAATKLEGKAHRPGLYQCNDCREQYTRDGRHGIRALQDRPAQVGAGLASDGRQQEGHVLQADPAHAGHHLQDRLVRDACASARRWTDSAKAGPIGGEGKIVESDETFVGGKKKNVHKGKPEPKKHAVHALVERGGQMRAKHVADVSGQDAAQGNRQARRQGHHA